MLFDSIIKQGQIVLENQVITGDIAIKDGLIAAIGSELGLEAKQIINAQGYTVLPGMIDAHAHISEPGRTSWEGYETGTNAAAKGGVTTLLEMPLNQLPATVDKKTLNIKFDAARGKMKVDIGVLGGIVPYNIDRLHELNEEGAFGYKCFVATCGDYSIDNDFRNINDYHFITAAEKISAMNQTILVHAENGLICDELAQKAMDENRCSAYDYVASRPVYTEVEAIRRVIYLAKVFDAKLHICHISSVEGVEEVTKAKKDGMRITCESCPHYLVLNTDDFAEIGSMAKCSPPIREKENQHGMWKKLLNGEIDCLVSDHSPCTEDLKQENIMNSWGGISGLQNCVDLMYDEAVLKKGMDLSLFSRLIATNAADIFSIEQKGRISVGKDADLVLIDPNSSYILSKQDLEYKNKFTPYLGRKISSRVIKTILRGNIIYDIESGFGDQNLGKFIFKKNIDKTQ